MSGFLGAVQFLTRIPVRTRAAVPHDRVGTVGDGLEAAGVEHWWVGQVESNATAGAGVALR